MEEEYRDHVSSMDVGVYVCTPFRFFWEFFSEQECG